jgi:hypothetical protein
MRQSTKSLSKERFRVKVADFIPFSGHFWATIRLFLVREWFKSELHVPPSQWNALPNQTSPSNPLSLSSWADIMIMLLTRLTRTPQHTSFPVPNICILQRVVRPCAVVISMLYKPYFRAHFSGACKDIWYWRRRIPPPPEDTTADTAAR